MKMLIRLMVAIMCVEMIGLTPMANAQSPKWKPLPKNFEDGCFDTMNPDIQWNMTGAVNWRTGKVVASSLASWRCAAGGWVFYSELGRSNFTKRTRLDQKSLTPIDHPVTDLAQDGSLRVFSFDQGHLWVSDDAGSTWIERGTTLDGTLTDFAVAAADSRVLYLLTTNQTSYTIYASTDAGATWEARKTAPRVPDSTPSIMTLDSIAAPTTVLQMTLPKAHYSKTIYLSLDGARSWAIEETEQFESTLRFSYTHEGLLRWRFSSQGSTSFDLSTDAGKTWQTLPTPWVKKVKFGAARVAYPTVLPMSPANCLVRAGNGLWYSDDGCRTWRVLADTSEMPTWYNAVPAFPLTIVQSLMEGPSAMLTLDEAGKSTTFPAVDVKAPGGRYFPETKHNLSPVLLTYWEQNGGSAQFGYPKTEPLMEYNPTDGKTYLVQYFERNRLEYHPELAGTDYEVLLGLLGKQLTATRTNEAPFLPFIGDVRPDQVFFPETKHTLGKPFRGYWEQNGGLAMYGYPISEPFKERNPDDGKTYTVQYFERARFEHHPEFKGTKSEVLLGLLGNTLLREKGWQ